MARPSLGSAARCGAPAATYVELGCSSSDAAAGCAAALSPCRRAGGCRRLHRPALFGKANTRASAPRCRGPSGQRSARPPATSWFSLHLHTGWVSSSSVTFVESVPDIRDLQHGGRTATSDPINGHCLRSMSRRLRSPCALPALSLHCALHDTTNDTRARYYHPTRWVGTRRLNLLRPRARRLRHADERDPYFRPRRPCSHLRHAHSDQAGPRHTGAHGGDRTLPLLGPALTQLPPPSRNPG